MAKTQGYGSTALQGVLTEDQKRAGFFMIDANDRVRLCRQIAEWPVTTATVAEIRDQADRAMGEV